MWRIDSKGSNNRGTDEVQKESKPQQEKKKNGVGSKTNFLDRLQRGPSLDHEGRVMWWAKTVRILVCANTGANTSSSVFEMGKRSRPKRGKRGYLYISTGPASSHD